LQEGVIKRATYGVLPYLSFLNGSIIPFSSPRQSSSRGPEVLKNQRKKQKRGFPIKDFGNDGGGSFLNGSIRNLNYLRARISGFPPKFQRRRGKGDATSGKKPPRYKKRGNITTILWLARMMGENM